MAGRKSWAEGSWWHGARGDPLGAIIFVVIVVFGLHLFTLWQFTSSALQRYYIDTYRASCSITHGPLVLPYVRWANGNRTLASTADIVALPPAASGAPRFGLKTAALARGAEGLDFVRMSGPEAARACVAVDTQIQANRAGTRSTIPTFILAPVLLVCVIFAFSVRAHRRSRRTMRRGQTLRGPELVSRRQFNRLKRADGISFLTRDEGLLAGRLGFPAGGPLSVRSKDESSHFLLMGDTGTGKSSLIRQLLEQVDQRNEAAIVYDPALEFTPQFYKPERGDQILNPLDTRMPYWSPGEEIQHRAEALAFSKALFPDDRRDNRFFIDSPRKIFARLLSFKPTAQEIASWLQNPREIDRLLAGTELATMIDPAAASQRAGVLASLSMIGDSFQLIPERTESTGTWSAYDWTQRRKGWLFLTSTPQTLDRLRPLTSVWLDLLLTRLLAGGPPVWLFLDELPTLNKLPKLPDALALARKPNVRLVIGLQGRAQLESRYGTESEAMLSQPATKVFMRTSEPRAAEWISKALGEVEFERLKESVNYDRESAVGLFKRKSHNYSIDRQTKPLVLASEVTGLSNLTAYLKSENYVVRFQFEPNLVCPRHPALRARPVDPKDWPQRPADPSATADSTPPNAAPTQNRRTPPRRDVSPHSRSNPVIERSPYFD